jgi:DNA-directed RNA polymerase II subunit RPB7
VCFKALVFRPLRGEVLDGIITGIEKVGLEVKVGACKVFIPHTRIPSEMKYSEE